MTQIAKVEDRTGFLGGSDIAAMLGVSPWKTPYQLWEEKLGMHDETEDSEQRAKVLKRGKRLEPVVMEMLQDEYELIVTDRNLVHVDDEYSWMRAEIDFEYLLEDGSVGNGDVKTVHPYAAKDWGESGSDQVPPYYVAQFQWGMMVRKRPICAVAGLIGADDLRLYYVPRDEELISMIRERAIHFWNNHVLAEVPPPAQSKEDAERILSRFDGVSIPASDDLRRAIAYLKGVKAAEKRLELRREQYETAIKLTLSLATANAEGKGFAITDGTKTLATWNPQTTSRIDVKALKELHPDVATEVTKQSTFRVLRLK